MVFRDKGLSDLIGFSYSKSEPGTAARECEERKLMRRSTPLVVLALLVVTAFAAGCQSRPKKPEPMPTHPQYRQKDAIEAIDSFIAAENVDKSNPSWKTELRRPPRVAFSPDHTYYWLLQTNLGNIKIKLLPHSAPMHVSNTVYLTRLGFYDGTLFHRVIPRFMAQGGDPLGNGSGGPGYSIAGEFDGKEKHNAAGMVSAANHGPRSDGSQFFITFDKAEHLDGKHTIYGEVVEGMGTVKNLEVRGSEDGTPRTEMLIRRATIQVD